MSAPIYEFRKNNKEVIRFEISEFMGKELINIRIWYLSQDFNTGETVYKPSQKGVAFGIHEFKELKEGVLRLEQYLADKNSGSMPDQPDRVDKQSPPPADYVLPEEEKE